MHCAGGFRASFGTSLLARAEHDVIRVDDAYSAAGDAGFATG